jgi:uncharacterized alpha-E superfamily protein
MLSRIAESLYWIGRYVERAEDTARITDVNVHHTLGMGISPDDQVRRQRQWEALLAIVGNEERFSESWGVASEDTVPPYLTLDTTNQNSVISCIARARELAGAMRHEIASEMWEGLNRFHLQLQDYRDQGTAAFEGGERAHVLSIGGGVQPPLPGADRFDDAAGGRLVFPAGRQVSGAGRENGTHD